MSGSFEEGRGRSIYSGGTKTPVGAEQPVPNTMHQHRLKLPTGAFVMGTWRHRGMPKFGAIVRSLGIGWCHQPVSIPLFFWYRLVALTGAYTRILVPGDALTRYQTSAASQRYELLL